MKKFLILFAAFLLAAGFVMADDLGITVGLEFGIYNVNESNGGIRETWIPGPNGGNRDPWLNPFASFGGNYLDGALGFFTKVAYQTNFYKGDLEYIPAGLYFDIALTYNLFLSADSTLSFTVENEMDRLMMTNRPESEDGSGLASIFSPAIKFDQAVQGAGDFYIDLKFPITYLAYYKDVDTAVDFEPTLGWNSSFGLGLWVREVLNLKVPEGAKSGHSEIDVCLSYTKGPFYAEVEADFRKVIYDDGICITPLVQYSFIPGLKAWLKCEIDAIGADSIDAVISPAMGVSFSF